MRFEFDIELDTGKHSVFITKGELHQIGAYIKGLFPEIWKSFVIADQTVYQLYGKQLINSLKESDLEPGYAIIPNGEQHKSLQMASEVYEQLDAHGIDRKSVIIALGGGMIGDLGGFVAASYLRGVPLIHVPTTLLAQADSCIGGKVAINHSAGKNRIGFFYNPIMIFTDVTLLKSLTSREINSGMAEIIRHGVILDKKFFHWIEENHEKIKKLDQETMLELVYRSCLIKKKVIERDHLEQEGYRKILNFGHTIAHVLEDLTDYKRYQHGEAVAIGMVQISHFAQHLGLITKKDVICLIHLLKKFNLPLDLPRDLSVEAIMKAIKWDKKSEYNHVTLVLPQRIGQVTLVDHWNKNELNQVLNDNLIKNREERLWQLCVAT